jgi:hypothetical protein
MKVLHLFRLHKIKHTVRLLQAAQHNLRELQAELGSKSHIDPSRTHLNIVLFGPSMALEVAQLAQQHLKEASLTKLRKDAVIAIECIIGLPKNSGIDEAAYFEESALWYEKYTGGKLLSAIVHNDEAEPHCHIILLPLINGHMIGSSVMGNRQKLSDTKVNHFNDVASKYGITQQIKMTTTEKRLAGSQIINKLEMNPEFLSNPNVRTALLKLACNDPYELSQVLDIHVSSEPKPNRDYVSIMISKGKGGNYEANQ